MIQLNADPVLIIYFIPKAATAAAHKGTPFIPIYLSEKITGLYVDTERETLSISTDRIVEVDKQNKTRSGLKVLQKGETQTVEISLVGRRDSVGLNLLLPLLKTIYDKVLSDQDYRLAYFHQNVLIFDARLAGFNKSQSRTDNLVTLEITLEVAPEQEKETEQPVEKMATEFNEIPIKAAA